MTEAGEKWASQVAELHSHDVEIVLRAFCDEVKKRARADEYHWPFEPEDAIADAFNELKRELLGDQGVQEGGDQDER